MDALKQLTALAQQARAEAQLERALQLYQQAQQQFPASISAAHNLASILNDLQRYDEALEYIEHACKLGGKAPQTWLMYARILTQLQQFESAQKAYVQAIQLAPAAYEPHREYAQLVWMRSGDVVKAIQLIDKVLQQQPSAALALLKSQIFGFAQNFVAAQDVLDDAATKWPNELPIQRTLIFSAIRAGDTEKAVQTAQRVQQLANQDISSYTSLCYAYLANRQPKEALAAAEQGLQLNKYHQELIANQATALRILSQLTAQPGYKEKYDRLYNYADLVAKIPLDAPAGWPSRQAFFADLATELKKLHPYSNHPFGQSVRHGSQLSNILSLKNPVIDAFRTVLEQAINQHIQRIQVGDHPLLERKSNAWKIDGIWSVWLQPGGYHEDHVHPNGWLSTACYIELPGVIANEETKAGWLRLGQPALMTDPAISAEHWVKPEVGHLVIFPSYMWHGTNPFSGDEPRLSIALDIVPG